MRLVIDIGNTDVAFGIYKGNKLNNVVRIKTTSILNTSFKTKDLDFIKNYNIKEVILSSVVPTAQKKIEKIINELFFVSPFIVSHKSKFNFRISTDDASEVGNDLLALTEGAIFKYKFKDAIIVDLGTATKIIALDNYKFIGCSILPGLGMSSQSLNEKTAQLPEIDFNNSVKAIGKNTPDCINSGLILGNYYAIKGLCEQFKQEMNKPKCPIIITGGYSSYIIDVVKFEHIFDQNLILNGLYSIYDLNRGD